jgi:hypothetical protein
MLDIVSDMITGIVELTAQIIYAIVSKLFGWEASRERPAWVRIVAISVILLTAAILFYVFLAVFISAFYALLAIAAIGAVIALFVGF